MKVSEKHFASFKTSCEKWISLLSLGGWQVYYQKKPMKESFAETSWKIGGRVATVTLNSHWEDSMRPLTEESLSDCALHECLHLCLADLHNLITERYINEGEVEEREEETVVRIQHAILGAKE